MMSYDVFGFCLVSFRLQALSQKLDSTTQSLLLCNRRHPQNMVENMVGNMLECRGHGMILQVLQARPVQPEEKKGPRDGAFLTWLRGLSEMKS